MIITFCIASTSICWSENVVTELSTREYARSIGGDALVEIINRESGWNHKAKNPNSSAIGLCQAMESVHDLPEDYKTNPYTQIDWCMDYIEKRYGTPQKALAFWYKNEWF